MKNRYESILSMRAALEIAMNGGKYKVEPETESDFIMLILETITGTELARFSEDVKVIILQLMALTDDRDFYMMKLQTNKEKN